MLSLQGWGKRLPMWKIRQDGFKAGRMMFRNRHQEELLIGRLGTVTDFGPADVEAAMASQMPDEVLDTSEHATKRQQLLQKAKLWTNRIAPDIALSTVFSVEDARDGVALSGRQIHQRKRYAALGEAWRFPGRPVGELPVQDDSDAQAPPRTVHYVMALQPEGEFEFRMQNYIAIRTAKERIDPDKMILHMLLLNGTAQALGYWFDLTLPLLDKIEHFSSDDVIGTSSADQYDTESLQDLLMLRRLQVLCEHGGISLHSHAIVLSSFDRLLRGSLVLGRKLKETPQSISPPGVRRAQQHFSISSAAMVAIPRHPVLLTLMNRCLDLLTKKPTPWVPLWAIVESSLEKSFAFDPGKVDLPPVGALVLPLGAMSSIGPDAAHGDSGASLFSGNGFRWKNAFLLDPHADHPRAPSFPSPGRLRSELLDTSKASNLVAALRMGLDDASELAKLIRDRLGSTAERLRKHSNGDSD